jgi:PDZ domain-containing protein
MRNGPAGQRPAVVEPAAAAVGLRLAGRPVPETGTVDAAIGAPWLGKLPVSWYRNLSLGPSHGLMVALVSYVDASGNDLAAGRTVAGTGGIAADGEVHRIGGLVAKAEAARQVGADVLLFPASQQTELSGFDPGGMQLLPVWTVSGAIAALETTA